MTSAVTLPEDENLCDGTCGFKLTKIQLQATRSTLCQFSLAYLFLCRDFHNVWCFMIYTCGSKGDAPDACPLPTNKNFLNFMQFFWENLANPLRELVPPSTRTPGYAPDL